ncbi:unnamed protein product [Fusarium venenatum]|uniref:Uncharacterized protein n=1 Tax=Fusarium venenatum TaxID=56646 RepID=A0A2L2TQ39_9HYPO|nr:uncharacterized protein FVRRES_02118 [Fusarium venenatum]CEI65606.1 unnamed protein product [Fusarium venenatum]
MALICRLAVRSGSLAVHQPINDAVEGHAQVKDTPRLAHVSTDHGQPSDGGLRISAPASEVGSDHQKWRPEH